MVAIRKVWLCLLAGAASLGFGAADAHAQRGRVRVAEVQISPPDAQVRVGQQAPFLATAYDNAGNPIATATFNWSSSNPRTASMDQNGIATGVAPGVAIITAAAGTGTARRSAQATIQVVAAAGGPVVPESQPPQPAERRPPPPSIRLTGPGCAAVERQPQGSGTPEALYLNPLRVTLVRGEVRELEYRVVRGDSAATPVCIVFEPDPAGSRIVGVDTFGIITAGTAPGRTTIRAVVQGAARVPPRTATVDVRADSVRFSASSLSLSPGAVDTLEMEVPAQDRRLNPAGIFQFTSSDPSKVRVSLVRPIIEGVAPGTARITAQSSIYEDITVTVNVHRRVASLAASPSDSVLTLAIGGSVPVQARAMADDTTPVPEAPLRWTMPDSTVARFDTTTKTLRGLRMGETRLVLSAPFGRDSSITRAWSIRVVAGGLLVSRTRVGLGVGERSPVGAQLLDDRRQPIGPATQLTWTTSNDSVARYADGQVTAVGRPGHARLTGRAPWDSSLTVEAYVASDLVLTAQRAGRWDLYGMMTRDPATFYPITRDSAVESQPAWSPDLTRLVYVAAPADRVGDGDLYVADADGSNPVRVTDDSASVGSPVFVRPAGDRIVYHSSRGGRSQLYIVGTDGRGRRALTSGDAPNSAPDVSPDGQKVVFVSLRETQPGVRNYDIYEMNMDGTNERRLTTSPRPEDSPAYSADGRSAYYLRDEGGSTPSKRLYRQDLTTGTAEAITLAGMFVQAFSANADGTLFALTVLETGRDRVQAARVVLFTPATGTQVPLPTTAGEQLAWPAFRPATPQPR